MKFGFVTCVQLGLRCMEEIYQVGGRLELVITLPDAMAVRKSGRVYVDKFCDLHGIDLVKTRNINDDRAIDAIRDHRLDWLFIIGWSQIARESVLRAPQRGVLGMHPTLLPQGRGRAAIPWAILKGLEKTGVTLFQLDQGVDTGPILAQIVLPLAHDETATSLYERVAEAHAELMRQAWPLLLTDNPSFRPQDETQATEWPERKPEDGRIQAAMGCAEVERLVRAVTRPYPGAFLDAHGERYRIWRGRAHLGMRRGPLQTSRQDGRLWFDLADGRYEAEDWTSEPLAPNA